MPAHGLAPAELETIRQALVDGRKPKVVFTDSAGQIAGQTGQVVSLGDPAQGDEWIVVRFGRDELPFSPADLTTLGRRTVAATKTTKPATATKPASANGTRLAVAKATKPTAMVKAKPASSAPVEAIKPAASPEPASPPASRTSAEPASPPASRTSAEPTPRTSAEPAAAKPARAAKIKAPTPLVVTLAYTERGEWTVGATQGSRAIVKPAAVRAADALRMVALLDAPSVRDAVAGIIEAERAQAEQRAAKLRAELVEIESRLAELSQRT